MIKTFCDICEKEITGENALTEGGLNTNIQREEAVAYIGVTTGVPCGDICKHCVLDALYKLDDRPTEKRTVEEMIRLPNTAQADLNNAMIKEAVDRFLQWPMPPGFSPDGGISFTRYFLGSDGFKDHYSTPFWPIGTNLFDAAQAERMFRHCLNLPTKE